MLQVSYGHCWECAAGREGRLKPTGFVFVVATLYQTQARDPFDVLVKGLSVSFSRDDRDLNHSLLFKRVENRGAQVKHHFRPLT